MKPQSKKDLYNHRWSKLYYKHSKYIKTTEKYYILLWRYTLNSDLYNLQKQLNIKFKLVLNKLLKRRVIYE